MKLKEDAEEFMKSKQGKYGNKTSEGGGEKIGKCQVCIMQSHDGHP